MNIFYHIFAVVLFLVMIFLSYFSIKKEHYKNRKLIRILAIILIVYKTIELSIDIFYKGWDWKYPTEYSTIFYFFFPIIVLLENKTLIGSSTTGAFISGTAYLIGLIFNINNMIVTQTNLGNIPGFIIGMISHSMLFYLSLQIIAKYKFNYKKEVVIVNLIAITIAFHAYAMSIVIPNLIGKDIFMIMIVRGTLLDIPYVLQILVVFVLYNIGIILFYKLNEYIQNKIVNKNL